MDFDISLLKRKGFVKVVVYAFLMGAAFAWLKVDIATATKEAREVSAKIDPLVKVVDELQSQNRDQDRRDDAQMSAIKDLTTARDDVAKQLRESEIRNLQNKVEDQKLWAKMQTDIVEIKTLLNERTKVAKP